MILDELHKITEDRTDGDGNGPGISAGAVVRSGGRALHDTPNYLKRNGTAPTVPYPEVDSLQRAHSSKCANACNGTTSDGLPGVGLRCGRRTTPPADGDTGHPAPAS